MAAKFFPAGMVMDDHVAVRAGGADGDISAGPRGEGKVTDLEPCRAGVALVDGDDIRAAAVIHRERDIGRAVGVGSPAEIDRIAARLSDGRSEDGRLEAFARVAILQVIRSMVSAARGTGEPLAVDHHRGSGRGVIDDGGGDDGCRDGQADGLEENRRHEERPTVGGGVDAVGDMDPVSGTALVVEGGEGGGVVDAEEPVRGGEVAVVLLIECQIGPHVEGVAGLVIGGIHDLQDDLAVRMRGEDGIPNGGEIGNRLRAADVERFRGIVHRELDEDDVGVLIDHLGLEVVDSPVRSLG